MVLTRMGGKLSREIRPWTYPDKCSGTAHDRPVGVIAIQGKVVHLAHAGVLEDEVARGDGARPYSVGHGSGRAPHVVGFNPVSICV